MRQADLKSVLRAMAKSVGVNLLVKNELKGDISVDFRGVAWDKAFTGLLRTYGLSYIWEDNIIRVMTIEDVEQELKRKVQLRDIQWVEPLLEPAGENTAGQFRPEKIACQGYPARPVMGIWERGRQEAQGRPFRRPAGGFSVDPPPWLGARGLPPAKRASHR